MSSAYGIAVWSYAKTRIPFDDRLEDVLERAVHAETGTVFKIAEHTDYAWTRLCIVEAYSRRTDVQTVTGTLWHYWWIPLHSESRNAKSTGRSSGFLRHTER